jgi:hypothetical protein
MRPLPLLLLLPPLLERSFLSPGAFVVVVVDAFSSSSSSSTRRSDVRFRLAATTTVGGTRDDDEYGDGDIFYDDFSGLSIGEVVDDERVPSFTSSLVIPALGGMGNNDDGRSRDGQTFELPGFDNKDGYDGESYSKPRREGRGEGETISIPLPKIVGDASCDLVGSTCREFGLGNDVALIDYAGSAGFDKVTDWQYYSVDVDEYDGMERNRTPVNPRPLDPNQPSRTRERGGGIVRLFRGELVGGTLVGKMRSRGLDARVWIKEYSGEDATELANSEKMGLGRLQSAWLRKVLNDNASKDGGDVLRRMEDGEWMEAARRRYVDGLTDTPTRADDENLITLLELHSSRRAQFPTLLGELNLNDYYDDEKLDPNEWYRSLGVKPPSPGSVWLIFDYHGTFTSSSYAVPFATRRSKMPPRRGAFGWGVVEPPPLPPFRERANYVVNGVLRGMLCALATSHDANIVHRSIGRNSYILSSVGQDKREATSPYAVVISRLRVILSDWGFSALATDAARETDLGVRSRIFGIPGIDPYERDRNASNDRIAIAATEFAKAEDLHALGFV